MKSRSKELLDRAIAATIAAIEIYNKAMRDKRRPRLRFGFVYVVPCAKIVPTENVIHRIGQSQTYQDRIPAQ